MNNKKVFYPFPSIITDDGIYTVIAQIDEDNESKMLVMKGNELFIIRFSPKGSFETVWEKSDIYMCQPDDLYIFLI